MGVTELLIVMALVVGLVIGVSLVIYFLSRRRRTQRSEEQRERTRQEFGSEYERTVEEEGSEEAAERELRERRVAPLSDDARARYEERWGEVERVFVENPERSIEMADRTVSDVLEERNFVPDPG